MSEGPSELASSGASSTTYRCFLFADLRGYTAFVERAGNAAGAALLEDYLFLTRRAVAQHRGAEIRTEGDGFYAVFPSASGAILCGLDIVRGAREASADRPERPIRVGVGINAGEAVQTAEGFVGSAVNLAARVCAKSNPGEVLVTSTVRGIVQSSVPVGFARRGRRRLKGVAEPVELFAVTSERVPPAAGRRRGPRGLAARGIVAAAGIAVAALLLLRPESPGAGASPSPSRPPPLAIGRLEIGSYLADQFQPPFDLVVSDPGWSVYRSGTEYLGLYFESQPQGRVDIGRIESAYLDACAADGLGVQTGSTPDELLSTLESIPHLSVGLPETITIGGRSGVAADVSISEGALAACGSFGLGEVTIFAVGTEAWRAQPGERFRIEAVDIDGTTVAMMLSAESAAASSISELEQFFELAGRLVDRITF